MPEIQKALLQCRVGTRFISPVDGSECVLLMVNECRARIRKYLSSKEVTVKGRSFVARRTEEKDITPAQVVRVIDEPGKTPGVTDSENQSAAWYESEI